MQSTTFHTSGRPGEPRRGAGHRRHRARGRAGEPRERVHRVDAREPGVAPIFSAYYYDCTDAHGARRASRRSSDDPAKMKQHVREEPGRHDATARRSPRASRRSQRARRSTTAARRQRVRPSGTATSPGRAPTTSGRTRRTARWSPDRPTQQIPSPDHRADPPTGEPQTGRSLPDPAGS